MSSQWAKASRISPALSGSMRESDSMVWSENTTPTPKVSLARVAPPPPLLRTRSEPLQRDREIEPSRAAADANRFHEAVAFAAPANLQYPAAKSIRGHDDHPR